MSLYGYINKFKIGYEFIEDFENIEDDIFQLTVFFGNGIDSVTDLPVYHELDRQYEIVKTHSYRIDIYKKRSNI